MKAEQTSQFNGADFLKWERASQDSLITYSITMTGVIATQGRQDIATCLDDWYSSDETTQKKRHDFILQVISENPTYHPQGVILAVLEKQCGAFKENSN